MLLAAASLGPERASRELVTETRARVNAEARVPAVRALARD